MTRKAGRPPRADGAAFSCEQVDAIYRDGIMVEVNGELVREYPGPTQIGRMVGVSSSTISRYAKRAGLDKVLAENLKKVTSKAAARPAARRSPGRPKRESVPDVNWDQVERDFIEGVARQRSDGSTVLVFLSQTELAECVGVSEATMSRFLTARGAQERRRRALAELPALTAQPVPSTRDVAPTVLVGSMNANLIEAARLQSQQWLEHNRAGDVRNHDPIVVKTGIQMGVDALARETGFVEVGGDTIQIPIALLERIRERRLLERQDEELDPLLTGMVIDTVAVPVVDRDDRDRGAERAPVESDPKA